MSNNFSSSIIGESPGGNQNFPSGVKKRSADTDDDGTRGSDNIGLGDPQPLTVPDQRVAAEQDEPAKEHRRDADEDVSGSGRLVFEFWTALREQQILKI